MVRLYARGDVRGYAVEPGGQGQAVAVCRGDDGRYIVAPLLAQGQHLGGQPFLTDDEYPHCAASLPI